MANNKNIILRDLPSVNKIMENIFPEKYKLPYNLILRTVRESISDFRKDSRHIIQIGHESEKGWR